MLSFLLLLLLLLFQHTFIPRDLAARNVLVLSEENLSISVGGRCVDVGVVEEVRVAGRGGGWWAWG